MGGPRHRRRLLLGGGVATIAVLGLCGAQPLREGTDVGLEVGGGYYERHMACGPWHQGVRHAGGGLRVANRFRGSPVTVVGSIGLSYHQVVAERYLPDRTGGASSLGDDFVTPYATLRLGVQSQRLGVDLGLALVPIDVLPSVPPQLYWTLFAGVANSALGLSGTVWISPVRGVFLFGSYLGETSPFGQPVRAGVGLSGAPLRMAISVGAGGAWESPTVMWEADVRVREGVLAGVSWRLAAPGELALQWAAALRLTYAFDARVRPR